MKRTITFLSAVVVLLSTGCSWKKYYLFRPTPSELAEQEAREKWSAEHSTEQHDSAKEGELANPTRTSSQASAKRNSKKAPGYGIEINVTDKHILLYCNSVKNMLRKRMTVSRIATEAGATLQVLTAAAGAAYGVTAAGGAVSAGTTEMMTALSGSSAVMPEVSKVFSLAQRSDAFSQGVALIEGAEAQYYASVLTEGGNAGQNKLSAAGAQLYSTTTAALKLVEHAVASRIPTVEELQAAQGVKFNQIHVEPELLRLKLGDATPYSVLVVDNGPVTAITTANKAIASSPTINGPTNRFDLTPGAQAGTTKITFINDKGGTGRMIVEVFRPVDATLEKSLLAPGESCKVTITPQSEVTRIDATPDGIITVVPAQGVKLTSATITAKSKGNANLTLRNEEGGYSVLTVRVE